MPGISDTLAQIFSPYADENGARLPEADEASLIAAAKAGDEDATVTLLLAYGRSIRAAVRNFANGVRSGRDPWADGNGFGTASFTEEDARSAALVGFLEVIREHDPARNPRLAGTVAQRIARELADLYGAVMPFAVPERTLSRFYGIVREAEGDLEAAEALAPKYDMKRETFRATLAAVRPESLDGIADATEGEVREIVAVPIFAPAPVADVEDRIMCDVAFAAVDDEAERICRLSYGFTEYDPVPDAEIGHRMGLTRPTVQRKRMKALVEMRKALGVSHAS